jgi:hypothetical protein
MMPVKSCESVEGKSMWSIGIYLGTSPFDFLPPSHMKNPVLSWQAISDVPAEFVADPFMLRTGGSWHMFFEVMNRQTQKGEIGLATSRDGYEWTYQQIVLAEPFHLSYPYVFESDNEYYMIPETLEPGAIHLYRAVSFPTRWVQVARLIEGTYADPSIFYRAGKWWMFACSTPYGHDTLRLYFADELMGHWSEHPHSPLVEGNNRIARPAGRVLVFPDKVIRYAQDCHPRYGSQVRAFEISELTTTGYHEKENARSPILTATGAGWNGNRMHHIDAQQISDGNWLACVDGFSELNDAPQSEE